ncbi:Uncharacterised protein [Mycobacteroides abscessus subsp. abscessus]|nr:Uncharacterised protein [Mycobacteroides abscessus subsp. abscessus]
MEAAPAGSTPIIFVRGETLLKYVLRPAINPPPPMLAKTKSIGSSQSFSISTAAVPCPAMIFSSSKGWTKAICSSSAHFTASL